MLTPEKSTTKFNKYFVSSLNQRSPRINRVMKRVKDYKLGLKGKSELAENILSKIIQEKQRICAFQ
jgi:hypothetical protein